jgi:hypothetical protein
VPKSQPYFDGLSERRLAKTKNFLGVDQVCRALRSQRTDHELQRWLEQLADWDEEASWPSASEIPFPLEVLGFNHLSDLQYAQLYEDIGQMRATVKVRRSNDASLRATQQALRLPRTDEQDVGCGRTKKKT